MDIIEKKNVNIVAKRKDGIILITKIIDVNYKGFVKCLCVKQDILRDKVFYSSKKKKTWIEYENLIDKKEFKEKYIMVEEEI